MKTEAEWDEFYAKRRQLVEIPLGTLEWLLIGVREGTIAASPHAIRDAGTYEQLESVVLDAGGIVP